jgi:hypothetical protein
MRSAADHVIATGTEYATNLSRCAGQVVIPDARRDPAAAQAFRPRDDDVGPDRTGKIEIEIFTTLIGTVANNILGNLPGSKDQRALDGDMVLEGLGSAVRLRVGRLPDRRRFFCRRRERESDKFRYRIYIYTLPQKQH